MTQSGKQLKIVTLKDRAAWRQWLERNHATSASVWLVVNKKNQQDKWHFLQ